MHQARALHQSIAVGLAISVVTFAAGSASAQPAAEPQHTRPKIGLALGGGSARGMAHVGVLKWFEDHHIPIDYIVGTSMGGLIAGAYASGMSPDEIGKLLEAQDWDLMFLSDSPYKYKTFRRKEDKREFPSLLDFGLKGGITLPGSLNPGQQVALLLDRIALPYGDLKSFDDLPTPYRAVATDLRKGEVVVLGKPPLSRAMRATMSIPGVFAPVNWDEWLLVDGGALNNIPADIAKKLGADIVIAVNVGAEVDPKQDEKAGSLLDLMGRTIDTMMTTSTRRALESADVVIDPDLKGLSSMSWRLSDELATRGYQGAASLEDKLQKYAIPAEEHAAFQAARQAKRRTEVPVPTYVAIQSLGPELPSRSEREIRRSLEPLLNKPLDPDEVARRILEVSGEDRYEYVTYSITENPKPTALQVAVRQKTYGPPFLMLGLDLNNIDSTNFAFNLAARVLHYGLLGIGSETRLDFVLGTNQRLGAEIVKSLGTTPYFVAGRGYFDRRGRNIYVDDVLVAEYRLKRTGVGFDVGTDFGRSAEMRLGYDVADVRGRRRVGAPDLPSVDGSERYAHLDFTFDDQTSPIVPTRGLRVRSTLRQYFAAPEASGAAAGQGIVSDQSFTSGEVRASWFRRAAASRGDRFFVLGEGGSSFGSSPLVNDFALGGPLRLGAFNNDQLRGDNYLLAVGGYLRGVGRLPDVLGGSIFLGGWVEAGSAFDDWKTKDWKSDITVGAVLETLLGPVFLGGSVGFQGGGRFYVALGPLFR